MKIISPVQIALSEAGIDNTAGDDAISNLVDFNLARGHAISISLVVGEIVQVNNAGVTDGHSEFIRQELDLDTDNVVALGTAGVVDTESINNSRLAIMSAANSLELASAVGATPITQGSRLVVPLPRPVVTTRDIRHHVIRQMVSGTERSAWQAMWMFYYEIVELTQAELVQQVISERSF